ncbi:response regulator transcription factor [Acidimangrovimonas sediminis]|uniref:response regulator transcription factor n=1 Tax=Acidimangrovimonas sediminis TaxID=2056283 RepID=UPI000C801D6F|nr:response regulator transcription factor [Acidimangrovimonas sediminis]
MRILIVEDDQFHAVFLQDSIAEALPEVTETIHATDGVEGEAAERESDFDGVVMDLQMERRNGIDTARTIWARHPRMRILFWSNYADEAYFRGISRIVPEEGTYGYLLKTTSRDRLKLALRAVLLEGQVVVDQQIHRLQHRAAVPGEALSESEYAVLIDLALGLQDRLIADHQGMSLRTVQNRLLALYEKLGVGERSFGDGVNKRVRAVSRAMTTRILNAETLEAAQKNFDQWWARQAGR